MLKIDKWINNNAFDNQEQIDKAIKSLNYHIIPHLATMNEVDCVNAVSLLRQASRKIVNEDEIFHIDGIELLKIVADKRNSVTQNVIQEINYEDEAIPWAKPLGQAAYHGIVGGFVREVMPFTVADPAAVMLNMLIGLSSIWGRNAYWEVSGSKHYCNLFGIIVGDTSYGAKGTSMDYPEAIIRAVDHSLVIKGGLSSSEGVIWQLRDPIIKPNKEGEDVVEDPGVADKRWLVYEPEFAAVLRQQQRSGNTLSEYLRQFWECKLQINTTTKNSPCQTSLSYLSFLGHITPTELRNTFSEESVFNGLGNRMIWVLSRRSKRLPNPPKFPEATFNFYVKAFKKINEFAKVKREIPFDAETAQEYEKIGGIFDELDQRREGQFGAMTARRIPIVRRLAVIYAILDTSTEVKMQHLRAALAIWKYADDSAKYLFAQASEEDPVADKILEFLKDKPEGLTQTDISSLFNRNKTAKQIKFALEKLSANGAIMYTQAKNPANNKIVNTWMITKPQNPLNEVN